MENDKLKKLFDEIGMDFYTQHPYCFEGELLTKHAKELRGKPLVYTEWGGWFFHYNPNLIKQFKRIVTKLAHAEVGEPRINGLCWWEWQDIFQFSRGLPGCIDGLLSEGLVDRFRNRTPSYDMMSEFFDLIDNKPEPVFDVEEYPSGIAVNETLYPVDLSGHYGQLNDKMWKEACSPDNIKCRIINQEFSSFSILCAERGNGDKGIYIHKEIKTLSGLRCDIPAGRPIILRSERSQIDITIGMNTRMLYLFGAVTYFDGYPVRGKFGESAAKITLKYADGSVQEQPMRHGLEMASSSLIACCTRVDAQAVLAPRVAKITLDEDWETYAINLLRIPADKEKTLNSISIETVDAEFEPVVFALSIS
jgi:hypothetical protein